MSVRFTKRPQPCSIALTAEDLHAALGYQILVCNLGRLDAPPTVSQPRKEPSRGTSPQRATRRSSHGAAKREQHRADVSDRQFETWVRAYGHTLLREAIRIVGDLDEAEDIVQQAWIRAYERRTQFSGRGSAEAWLWRICRNIALDCRRSRFGHGATAADSEIAIAIHSTGLDSQEATAMGLATQELADLVDDTIMALPGLQRRAATLRWLLGWRLGAIALCLGVASGTIRAELFRARGKLRSRLSQFDPDLIHSVVSTLGVESSRLWRDRIGVELHGFRSNMPTTKSEPSAKVANRDAC